MLSSLVLVLSALDGGMTPVLFERSAYGLPFVTVRLNGHEVTALIDSGSVLPVCRRAG